MTKEDQLLPFSSSPSMGRTSRPVPPGGGSGSPRLSGRPWFKFWAADFLADEDIARLPLEARGALATLWAYCWREGSIPSDPAVLCLMIGLGSEPDPHRIRMVSDLLSDFFAPDPVRPERMLSSRMERERQEGMDRHKRASEASRIANEARWKKSRADAVRNPSDPEDHRSRIGSPPGSESKSEVKTPLVPLKPPKAVKKGTAKPEETLEEILEGGRGTPKFEGYWKLVATMGGSQKNPAPKTTAKFYANALHEDEVSIASIQRAAESYAGGFKRGDERFMVQLAKWLEQGGYLAQAVTPLKTARQLRDEEWLREQEARVVR